MKFINFFLVIALIYTLSTKSKTKNQANKTSTNPKENNEVAINSKLELKIEEIYQKLKTGDFSILD